LIPITWAVLKELTFILLAGTQIADMKNIYNSPDDQDFDAMIVVPVLLMGNKLILR
jgi:hypothetical protein